VVLGFITSAAGKGNPLDRTNGSATKEGHSVLVEVEGGEFHQAATILG
jgi:hypothetical protein